MHIQCRDEVGGILLSDGMSAEKVKMKNLLCLRPRDPTNEHSSRWRNKTLYMPHERQLTRARAVTYGGWHRLTAAWCSVTPDRDKCVRCARERPPCYNCNFLHLRKHAKVQSGAICNMSANMNTCACNCKNRHRLCQQASVENG